MNPKQLAKMIVENPVTREKAIKNIQRDPRKMATASYSKGIFGRRWTKTIKECVSILGYNINLNGCQTELGMLIVENLKKANYDYNNNFTEFTKIEKVAV